MSLDNGSNNPSRCSKRECHITGFDVTVTPGTNTVSAVIVDPCNQITECRMAKAILTSALTEFFADEDLTLPDGACKSNCCDGIYGAEYVVATNTVTLAFTGIVAGAPVTYEVTPPFGVVN